ncbi:MAG: Rieske 2Fe-2S domain-containing protein [Granulosicoccus sp.]
MIDLEAARYRWHPVAASSDLVPRHVFHAQILGREMALWRADDGNVNAWENRCLHRGVRLSIGINDGHELTCQYHGWRYANRTAGCTYIPAHPADAPARTICNNTYPVAEKHGLVWSGEIPEDHIPDLGMLDNTAMTPLRAITVNAGLHQIQLPLIDRYNASTSSYREQASNKYGADNPDPFLLLLRANLRKSSNDASLMPDVAFFFQPLDAGRTVIRGILCGVDDGNTPKAVLTQLLKQHDHILCRLRDEIESNARHMPAPAPWIPIIASVSEANASIPALNTSGRDAALRLRVAHIDNVSHNVKKFRLEPLDAISDVKARSSIPAPQPGAHIDVHLPNALVRQYSLINGPGQTDHYAFAVKLLDNSSGGSRALHDTIKVGDVLATSVPRNNFTLRRDAEHTHLIAGGIGITPLMSMARALANARLPFTLHHFVASDSDRLFQAELDSFYDQAHVNIGLDPQRTQSCLSSILSSPLEHHHVYICGPGPMLSFARESAMHNGWADANIHFEYFKNILDVDDSKAFSVELARSGLTLDVPAGTSLLDVLKAHDVGVPSSCEQGACGTCRVAVLSGDPDHQDVYLSDSEKARKDCLMSCVSRARSQRLVLDL